MHRYPHGIAVIVFCAAAASGLAAAPAVNAVVSTAPALAAQPLSVTYAEQPLRLLREMSLASAPRGIVLNANDIIETGAGATQLDAGGAAVALSPGARLYVRGPGELVLVHGWLKAGIGAARALRLATADLQIDGAADAGNAASTVIMHASSAGTEVFVESGEAALTELAGGKAGRQLKLTREQFAARAGAAPVKVLPRPGKEFFSSMPPAFRDTLVTLTPKPGAAPVLPKPERPAVLADVNAMLAEHTALRQQAARRFAPRTTRPAGVPPPAPASRPPSDVY